MNPSYLPKRRVIADINVVPYIDVMLVLLVVFMITAPMLEEGVTVDLPDARAAELKGIDKSKLVIVSVNATGEYFMDAMGEPKEPKTLEQIEVAASKIMSERADAQVYVRGDERVVYGKVVQLMAVLQRSGVPNVGLMTEAKDY